LVGVQIVQPKLVDQRLLDFFVKYQEPIGIDLAAAVLHRARHMTVDVDRFAVVAVARQIGHVMMAIELLDAPHHGVERAIQHQARDIPLRDAELPVRRFGMAKIERHCGPPPRGTDSESSLAPAYIGRRSRSPQGVQSGVSAGRFRPPLGP